MSDEHAVTYKHGFPTCACGWASKRNAKTAAIPAFLADTEQHIHERNEIEPDNVPDAIRELFRNVDLPMTAAEVRWHLDWMNPQPSVASVSGVLRGMARRDELKAEQGWDYVRAPSGEFASGTRQVQVTWYEQKGATNG